MNDVVSDRVPGCCSRNFRGRGPAIGGLAASEACPSRQDKRNPATSTGLVQLRTASPLHRPTQSVKYPAAHHSVRSVVSSNTMPSRTRMRLISTAGPESEGVPALREHGVRDACRNFRPLPIPPAAPGLPGTGALRRLGQGRKARIRDPRANNVAAAEDDCTPRAAARFGMERTDLQRFQRRIPRRRSWRVPDNNFTPRPKRFRGAPLPQGRRVFGGLNGRPSLGSPSVGVGCLDQGNGRFVR